MRVEPAWRLFLHSRLYLVPGSQRETGSLIFFLPTSEKDYVDKFLCVECISSQSYLLSIPIVHVRVQAPSTGPSLEETQSSDSCKLIMCSHRLRSESHEWSPSMVISSLWYPTIVLCTVGGNWLEGNEIALY